MRRGRIVVALAVAFVFAFAGQANAIQWAEKCRHHDGPDGNGGADADICVMINASDVFLWERIEGMSEWHDHSPTGISFDIEFDYVRLWRIGTGGVHEIVEQKEQPVTFDSRFDFRYSTEWYDLCQRVDDRNFYGAIRYRLTWHFTGQPSDTGPWYSLTSYQKFVNGC